jgi:acetyl esterase/lipase
MRFLTFFIAITLFSSCAFRRINRDKGIVYQGETKSVANGATLAEQKLDVYVPKRIKKGEDLPVLIFVHGGNWNEGRRGLYKWFGGRLARKGMMAVIIDYPLSPAAQYDDMAQSTAQAIAWVSKHAAEYGGNPDRIFVSGHSAGGHLSALVALDGRYLEKAGVDTNVLKGAVMIDAAGLDMYTYLKNENGLVEEPTYAQSFTTSPAEWKKASPIFYITPKQLPMLIFQGGRTYPSIERSNARFIKELNRQGAQVEFKLLPRKKHVPMITQFLNPFNKQYGEIIRFMNRGGGSMR